MKTTAWDDECLSLPRNNENEKCTKDDKNLSILQNDSYFTVKFWNSFVFFFFLLASLGIAKIEMNLRMTKKDAPNKFTTLCIHLLK